MILSAAMAQDVAVEGCHELRGPAGDAIAQVRGSDAVAHLRGGDGQVSSVALQQLRATDVTRAVPFRRWRSRPGQRHLPGSYWSATTGGHVVYESQLELCRVLLADFDVPTVDIRAQPLRLTAIVDGRKRSHVPDFLLVSADGAVTVVNVKLASRVADPRVAEQLAWPAALFTAHGWRYEVWTGCDATVLANVRFLAGYRRDSVVARPLAAAAADAVRDGEQLACAERRLATDGLALGVRPALLAALWRGMLRTDLQRPLGGDSVLHKVLR